MVSPGVCPYAAASQGPLIAIPVVIAVSTRPLVPFGTRPRPAADQGARRRRRGETWPLGRFGAALPTRPLVQSPPHHESQPMVALRVPPAVGTGRNQLSHLSNRGNPARTRPSGRTNQNQKQLSHLAERGARLSQLGHLSDQRHPHGQRRHTCKRGHPAPDLTGCTAGGDQRSNSATWLVQPWHPSHRSANGPTIRGSEGQPKPFACWYQRS